MHSIERYGIVALLFLVVTVMAVLLWDGDKKKEQRSPDLAVRAVEPGAASRGAASDRRAEDGSARSLAEEEGAEEEGAVLTLVADARPGPLQRDAELAEPERGAPQRPSGPRGAGQALLDEPPASEPVAPAADGFLDEEPQPAADEGLAAPERRSSLSAGGAGAQRRYLVRPGDTLSEVAQRELGSAKRWQEIAALNPGLNPASLRAGKEIRLPDGPKSAAPSSASPDAGARSAVREQGAAPKTPKTTDTGAAAARTWKVGRGESLWKIAERTLGDGKRWREIADLNPSIDPDRLSAGVTLKLPSAARASEAGATKTAQAKPRSSSSAPKASTKKPEVQVASAPASAPASDRPGRRGGKVK